MSAVRAIPSTFIPEEDVSGMWPILPLKVLRRARRKREIAFYKSPAGPHYKAADVEDFIERKLRQCPADAVPPPNKSIPMPVGNLAATTSINHIQNVEDRGTPVSMTPERDELLAAAYEQQISNRPKSRWSHSSRPRPSPVKKRLTPETSAP